MKKITIDEIIETKDKSIYYFPTKIPGPEGNLPLTPEILLNASSGELFGWSMDAGMGWTPGELGRKEFLILGHYGGIRGSDGRPIALGYHTGHYEIGWLMEIAAEEFKTIGTIPFAGYCTDPCDGRTQGTPGMMDSLAYRNDSAVIYRRLIRSIPTVKGVMGVAGCDKSLPAMMMALISMSHLPGIIVPGGVTLPPVEGENTAKIQSISARFSREEISLEDASRFGCNVCASQGGSCHFLGTAATGQVVAEALGLTLTHAALAPSGQPIWADVGKRSARALLAMEESGISVRDIISDESIENALVVHAAFGGSTNYVLHLPAIAFAAGLPRPTVDKWSEINRKIPRLVDVLPNGPLNHPTIRAYLAGGVPEVMLHLRRMQILHEDCLTVMGKPLGEMLDWWEGSERRKILRERLFKLDGVDPDDVIMSPERARQKGMASTTTFPKGNLAPEGSVVKSTAIDPTVVDADGVYRKVGPARVFTQEKNVIFAIKGRGVKPIKPGDIIVLMSRGPMGAGMEEIFQVTAALRYLSFGKHVALLTDARFSGVSTGACIGLIGPEALAGGPIGKVREGDTIQIIIDLNKLEGSLDLVGDGERTFTPEEGKRILAERSPHPALAPDPDLPDDTKLWAALQDIGGGTWGGCVYDTEKIVEVIKAGRKALNM